jgi:hypothetical protein
VVLHKSTWTNRDARADHEGIEVSGTFNAVSRPDENFMRFEIRDGIRRISCAVSNEALEAVSGLPAPSTEMLRRRSFDRFRTLINMAAKLKLSMLPSGSISLIVLTDEDLRRVPPETGVPSFGSSARGSTPTAAALVPPRSRQVAIPKIGSSWHDSCSVREQGG